MGEWAFMVERDKDTKNKSIKGITISNILDKYSFDYIDILKLDIEGAEKEVFSINYQKWLNKVRILIIELHGRMKKGCESTFYSAIKKYDFNIYFKGENIILIRKEYQRDLYK